MSQTRQVHGINFRDEQRRRPGRTRGARREVHAVGHRTRSYLAFGSVAELLVGLLHGGLEVLAGLRPGLVLERHVAVALALALVLAGVCRRSRRGRRSRCRPRRCGPWPWRSRPGRRSRSCRPCPCPCRCSGRGRRAAPAAAAACRDPSCPWALSLSLSAARPRRPRPAGRRGRPPASLLNCRRCSSFGSIIAPWFVVGRRRAGMPVAGFPPVLHCTVAPALPRSCELLHTTRNYSPRGKVPRVRFRTKVLSSRLPTSGRCIGYSRSDYSRMVRHGETHSMNGAVVSQAVQAVQALDG